MTKYKHKSQRMMLMSKKKTFSPEINYIAVHTTECSQEYFPLNIH